MNGRKAGVSDEAVKGCPEEVACERGLGGGLAAGWEVDQEGTAVAGRESRLEGKLQEGRELDGARQGQ